MLNSQTKTWLGRALPAQASWISAHRAPDLPPAEDPSPEPAPHPHHPPVPAPQDDPVPDHNPS
jgi:hypothetical protein